MTIAPVVPPTATTPTVFLPLVPAFMAPLFMPPLTTVMPVTPALNRPINTGGIRTGRVDTGHIHHPGRRWWGVDHAGLQGIHHGPWYTHLGIHRKMADAGVNRHRRLDHHWMGATHLCQTQAQQAEQRDGS